ncbi:Uncharacterised protein [Mycobacterium tuberculosis]|nr:Uncharacterised protein [Mycobacterium tuberculosis]
MGGADGGCGGAELCGTHTEVCGKDGANSGSLLGASVDAEEEPSLGGDAENGHGAVGAGAADGVEAVGDGGHFFEGNADGTPSKHSRPSGVYGPGEVTDGCNGGAGNHGVS